MDSKLYDLEKKVLDELEGKFVNIKSDQRKYELVKNVAKSIKGDISEDEVGEIFRDINDLSPIDKLIADQFIEDVMINNTKSIFYYHTQQGSKMLDKRFESIEELDMFVRKLKTYATNSAAKGNILDVHMQTGSRANIVSSPIGYDITIRNFKNKALSIIDLINLGVMDYSIAARLWVYVDGFKARPANILFGGMPAVGKTTMLNAMFSFFRPEQRIVTIEETYELDTSTQENCVRLETSEDLSMQELVKNTLRMRPDMIIVGEVRGAEARDMVTAMNIGKNCMSTIHASSTRDIINRLQNEPMNVPAEIIPAIDVLFVLSQVYIKSRPYRKVVQIS
ncbi:MAG: ATPase, T2SS/T4P/T4SS family, partial [Candidatus Micrarchaeaceae archaeon]